jgi:hypothetical protein
VDAAEGRDGLIRLAQAGVDASKTEKNLGVLRVQTDGPLAVFQSFIVSAGRHEGRGAVA